MAKLLGYPGEWYEARLAGDTPVNFDAPTEDDLPPALARINMLLTFDRADELDGIRAPVLVLGAVDDAIVPVAHSRDLVRRLSTARLIEMQGGHFLPQTQTAHYVAALETFLSEPV